MIRVASFNVENLFDRPKAMVSSDPSVGKPILQAFEKVNNLFQKTTYSAADKQKMIDLLVELDIYRRNSSGAARRNDAVNPKWAWFRKNRGSFDKQPQAANQDIEIIATGRGSWIGWVELAVEPVDETATQMTARVINDVGADVLGVVEAEDRPALVRFNQDLLQSQYSHIMLVDGNDTRGIDVGIMTKASVSIDFIVSNVDNADGQGVIFSRDCPQYALTTAGGNVVHVLVNHFKSQSGGGGPKRLRQATEVRRIVDGLVAAGEHVVVMGDLNEGPSGGNAHATNLDPLYSGNSPLLECWSLNNFDPGPRPGSYGACTLSNRLDYIFISKSLKSAFKGGGVFRTGQWGGHVGPPTDYAIYPEITAQDQQASDHAALFVDLDI